MGARRAEKGGRGNSRLFWGHFCLWLIMKGKKKRSGKRGVATKVAKLDLMQQLQQCDHVATIELYGNIQEAKDGS